MTANLMDQYIQNTRNNIKDFTKMFFGEEYNEEISNEYIDTYIESRIYNFGEGEDKFFYIRINSNLSIKKNELQMRFPKIEEKVLDDNLRIYQFVFYIDGVRPIADLPQFCKLVCDKRNTQFELKSVINLEERLLKLIKRVNEEKESFFKKYETEYFSLNIEKYKLIDNTYKVDLNYEFKIPYIYSEKVIEEVYNEGVINEDKLMIEYTLLTLLCIKDINKGKFDTKYIVNFASSLYKKKQKLKQTLKILDNAVAQDKVFLKLNYHDFEENKELIYELMKDGFRFAIIIDDIFNPSIMELKKLSIFKYLLIEEQSKNYDEIKRLEQYLNNIVIYEV
ncbi:MAG TPA: hypothetical protein DEP51_06775 [Clostridiales bacterium]|nr:hypothetical protein [Clostridiales bacterium]